MAAQAYFSNIGKFRSSVASALLLFSILFSVLISTQSKAQTLKIGVGEWPPYISESIEKNGFLTDLIVDILAEAGYDSEVMFFPWKRAYSNGVKGNINLTAVWMYKPERAADYYYSDPILTEQFVFFHLKDKPFDWNQLEQLWAYTIGGDIKYSYGAEFDSLLASEKLTMVREHSPELNFRKLIKGRTDLYIQEVNVGYSTLMTELADKRPLVTHHPKPVLNNYSYVLFPKSLEGSPELLKNFNAKLKEFRESGKYQTYFDAFKSEQYPLKNTQAERAE
ncbi:MULTISPECIES: ABC transporter substrate-binding protein [Vibrio]|uniref:substrate-binding periplasmic protein n=1 Tax=Vibrio TaxID=662 RepID=UPI00142EE91D|nr:MULTISPECIES: transporter substrate-binding domain-containing protein [Vibrio]